jgi:hypothetical protein
MKAVSVAVMMTAVVVLTISKDGCAKPVKSAANAL